MMFQKRKILVTVVLSDDGTKTKRYGKECKLINYCFIT